MGCRGRLDRMGGSLQYNSALDGVRALAALAVVALHCKIPIAHGGMIGVDVFFVLSGFLITTILRSEMVETGRISLSRFYWRRALRLWPPLLLMLAAYVAIGPLAFPHADVVSDATLAGLYLSDYAVAFWHEPLNILHTWSLSVEEHFYLLWPFAILATRRLSGSTLVALLAIGFVMATVWRVADTLIWQDFYRTYYRFDTRMSGLILGGVIAVMPWRPSLAGAKLIGGISVFILVLAMLTLRIRTSGSLLAGGLVVDLAAAGLILSLVSGHATLLGQMLSWQPLTYLGLISYPVYLWHYPIARAVRDQVDPVSTFLIVTTLSVAIAAASYEFVEKPLRMFRGRRLATA